MLFLPLTGWFRVAGPVALILAGGCTFAGWGVTRARAREASFGLVLGALTALVALSWVAFAWTFGAVMPMSIIVAVLSVTATTLIARSLREIRRIDAARE
jgi:Kef-type K+ transport system membrane component KefB